MIGTFIVVDGPDGAGKSTLIKGVVAALVADGHPVLATREPGGAPFAEAIRELILHEDSAKADPLTMLYLFNAARQEHLVQTVRPALGRGDVVICDRFDSSTYAYQVIGEERPDLGSLFGLLRTQYQATLPYYLMLDVSPEVGRTRMTDRAKQNHFDERDAVFHERVRGGFKDFLASFCKPDNFSIINAESSPEEVLVATLEVVRTVVGQSKLH